MLLVGFHDIDAYVSGDGEHFINVLVRVWQSLAGHRAPGIVHAELVSTEHGARMSISRKRGVFIEEFSDEYTTDAAKTVFVVGGPVAEERAVSFWKKIAGEPFGVSRMLGAWLAPWWPGNAWICSEAVVSALRYAGCLDPQRESPPPALGVTPAMLYDIVSALRKPVEIVPLDGVVVQLL